MLVEFFPAEKLAPMRSVGGRQILTFQLQEIGDGRLHDLRAARHGGAFSWRFDGDHAGGRGCVPAAGAAQSEGLRDRHSGTPLQTALCTRIKLENVFFVLKQDILVLGRVALAHGLHLCDSDSAGAVVSAEPVAGLGAAPDALHDAGDGGRAGGWSVYAAGARSGDATSRCRHAHPRHPARHTPRMYHGQSTVDDCLKFVGGGIDTRK